MNHSEQPACKVCRSSRLRQRPFGYDFDGRWLQAWECLDCKTIFLHPQPTQEELVDLYTREYFESDFRCGHAGSYFDSASLSTTADEGLLREIKKYKPSGEFLEVGCAGGRFLNAARNAGYRVSGVEVSEDAARFAYEEFGLEVFRGEVLEAHYPPDKFDVVFMGDVLEHLPDPLATLREINRIVKVGGLLVIECPMQTNTMFSRVGFAIYSMLGRTATVHLPPYHLFEYRPTSMSFLLEKCGFSISRLKEGIIPPRHVMLRGSWLQRVGKKLFQYPNFLATRLFAAFGDRLEVFALKRFSI